MSLFGESDSSDDERRRAKPTDKTPYFYNILDELSKVGYHRSRVLKLAEFDRITGGLCFLISRLDHRICHGLRFYEVDERLGQDSKHWEQAVILIKIVKQMKCPYKLRVRDLISLKMHRIEPAIRWVCSIYNLQSKMETNYSFFENFFKREFETAEDAARDYKFRLHCLNKSKLCDDVQHSLFDNAIIFHKDAEPLAVLLEYLKYRKTGRRSYPRKWVPLPEETPSLFDFAEALKERQISTMEKLTAESKDAFPVVSDNQKLVMKTVLAYYDEFRAALKLYYFEKRLIMEGERFHEINSENLVLERQYKSAMDHAMTFDQDAMEELHVKLNTAQDRANAFLIDVIKEYKATKDKEQELRENKKNGVLQRYSAAGRELVDAYNEKRMELKKVLVRASHLQKRLYALKERKGQSSRLRLAELRTRQRREGDDEAHVSFTSMDRGCPNQLTHQLEITKQRIATFMSMSKNRGDDAEDLRSAFLAYAWDYRIILEDWHRKSVIIEAHRMEGLRRNNFLKRKLKKLTEDSMYAGQEFEKMFKITRAIQEVSHQHDSLETILAEFKKPCGPPSQTR